MINFVRMKTKLTLSIEKSVIEEAKELLRTEGDNLSRIVENYLRKIIDQKKSNKNYPIKEDELLPQVHEIMGIFKTANPDNRTYKERLAEELQKKYGERK